MRPQPILLLTIALTWAACGDTGGPPDDLDEPSTQGTLVVSTATRGNDLDQDGYVLTVDRADSFPLAPTGIIRIDLPMGLHALQLLDVAVQCSVGSGGTREVDVRSTDTTRVGFEIHCLLTGVRIAVKTSGPDRDPDGYRVVVDGIEREAVPTNGSVFVRTDSGTQTVGLSGLSSNCTVDSPETRTVTIVTAEVVAAEFAVTCFALPIPPPAPVLAFSSYGEIHVARTDGSDLRRLTAGSHDREPAWSPDGNRIAFTRPDGLSGWAIYVMNADGTHQTRLTPKGIPSASPTWSPDGSRIAFQWRDDEIHVINADGTHHRRLTTHRYGSGYPAWAPDGSRIAYAANVASGRDQIFVVDADGTSREQLTSGPHNDSHPAWSPDSRRIVFTRDGALFQMDADGTNPTPLTPPHSGFNGARSAAWSPDGDLIAFGRTYDCIWDSYGDPSCRRGIWVISAAGGSMHELPLGAGSESDPSWRP